MNIKEIRFEFTKANINIAHITDEQLEKTARGLKQVLGSVREGMRITSNIINSDTNNLDKIQIEEMNRYYKHLNRVENRQMLYEKRKRLGKV